MMIKPELVDTDKTEPGDTESEGDDPPVLACPPWLHKSTVEPASPAVASDPKTVECTADSVALPIVLHGSQRGSNPLPDVAVPVAWRPGPFDPTQFEDGSISAMPSPHRQERAGRPEQIAFSTVSQEEFQLGPGLDPTQSEASNIVAKDQAGVHNAAVTITAPQPPAPSTVANLRVGYNIRQECIVCRNIARSPIVFGCTCSKVYAFCASHLDHFNDVMSTGTKHAREEQAEEDPREELAKRTRGEVLSSGSSTSAVSPPTPNTVDGPLIPVSTQRPPTSPSFDLLPPSTPQRAQALSTISSSTGSPTRNHQPAHSGLHAGLDAQRDSHELADKSFNTSVYFDALSQPQSPLQRIAILSPQLPRLPRVTTAGSPDLHHHAQLLSSPGFSDSFELRSWTSAQPRSSLEPGLHSDPPLPPLDQHSRDVSTDGPEYLVASSNKEEAEERDGEPDSEAWKKVLIVSDYYYPDDVSISST